MTKIKTRAYVEDVEVFDKPDGVALAMQCLTPEFKSFSLTLICHPQAVDKSMRGRNWRIIEKMLGGVSLDEWERAHFDTKVIVSGVRETFHWFLLERARDSGLWLRDVKPCQPFALYDEDAAIRAVEEFANVS